MVKLEAIYSYVSEFTNIDYNGYETSGENSDKVVMFKDSFEMIKFLDRNNLTITQLTNGMVIVTDKKEDKSILGKLTFLEGTTVS